MNEADQLQIMHSAVEGAVATFGAFLDQLVEAIVLQEERKLSRFLDPDERESVMERVRQTHTERRAAALALMVEGSRALVNNAKES